mgnify:CR=1 FL=1
MLDLIYQSKFKKDFERAKKRGKKLKKLETIINLLLNEKSLPAKNRNHKLSGNYNHHWECHIEPDWLLIYLKNDTEIILVRTGSHADLFE